MKRDYEKTPITAGFTQLGCGNISKSLKNNQNTNILIQEYLSSIFSIKWLREKSYPAMQFFMLIILLKLAIINA